MNVDVDVAIVGAGPAGLCLARALSGRGLSVAMIERRPKTDLADPAFDGREIALTCGSRRFLQALGIWSRLRDEAISPLRQARVLDGNSPFALDIQVDPADADALGWLVANHRIRRAAWEEVRGCGDVQIHAGVGVIAVHEQTQRRVLQLDNGQQFSARLLVAAHGFNFGLQGAQRLALRVLRAHAQCGDVGDLAELLSYASAHRWATWPLYQTTNLVAALYADDRLPARFLRQGALRMAARVSPFRQAVLAQLRQ